MVNWIPLVCHGEKKTKKKKQPYWGQDCWVQVPWYQSNGSTGAMISASRRQVSGGKRIDVRWALAFPQSLPLSWL